MYNVIPEVMVIYQHCLTNSGWPHTKLSKYLENRVNKLLEDNGVTDSEVIVRLLASSRKEVNYLDGELLGTLLS